MTNVAPPCTLDCMQVLLSMAATVHGRTCGGVGGGGAQLVFACEALLSVLFFLVEEVKIKGEVQRRNGSQLKGSTHIYTYERQANGRACWRRLTSSRPLRLRQQQCGRRAKGDRGEVRVSNPAFRNPLT